MGETAFWYTQCPQGMWPDSGATSFLEAVWCHSGPFFRAWLQPRESPASFQMCCLWGLIWYHPPDPTSLRTGPIHLCQCTQKLLQISLKFKANVSLPSHYQTHISHGFWTGFLYLKGGLYRMKGRLARCKWVLFDYLKAHLIKLDSLPAWGKLNEN